MIFRLNADVHVTEDSIFDVKEIFVILWKTWSKLEFVSRVLQKLSLSCNLVIISFYYFPLVSSENIVITHFVFS